MDLAILGDLGDLIGGVGVVVSLVYLAAQVRQNTRAVRAASFQGLSDAFSDRVLRLAESDELHTIYRRGLRGEKLSEADAQRFASIMLSLIRLASNAFVQYRAGLLTEEQWQGFSVMPNTLLSSAGGRAFWARARTVFGAEFAALWMRPSASRIDTLHDAMSGPMRTRIRSRRQWDARQR